jgi:acyl-coenzyme A thioesterase PaaI-like protein
MPDGNDVLTVEFKINLVAPAAGERLVASARVLKAGRTLTLTEASVHAHTGEAKKLVAHLVATMITIGSGVESRSLVR